MQQIAVDVIERKGQRQPHLVNLFRDAMDSLNSGSSGHNRLPWVSSLGLLSASAALP
jgi:hypothetical protein